MGEGLLGGSTVIGCGAGSDISNGGDHEKGDPIDAKETTSPTTQAAASEKRSNVTHPNRT